MSFLISELGSAAQRLQRALGGMKPIILCAGFTRDQQTVCVQVCTVGINKGMSVVQGSIQKIGDSLPRSGHWPVQ